MTEIWKIYKTTNSGNKQRIYEVSNYGNVKINGRLVDLDNEYNHKSYYRFGAGYFVHRAVAELFIPNTDNKPCIDHIDANTFNNNVNNLRWVTHKENSNNPICKKRISKSLKCRVITDEWKRNISVGTKKAMENPELRTHLSEKAKGNKNGTGKRTDKQKQNISIETKKAMQNPELKKQLSEKAKSRHAKWMTNGIDSKSVPEIEQQYYLEHGYYYGRTCTDRNIEKMVN